MLLAIFPLQLIIFPGETLPLHIFEPRYKELILECRDAGITFGIPAHLGGSVSHYGTEVELVKIFRTYDNGEMDILVRGIRVFTVGELHAQVEGKLYSGATVSFPENDPDVDDELRNSLTREFEKFLRLTGRLLPTHEDSDVDLSFRIAPAVELPLERKIELLSLHEEQKREEYLLKHLQRLVESIPKKHNADVKLGGNGHTKGNGWEKA